MVCTLTFKWNQSQFFGFPYFRVRGPLRPTPITYAHAYIFIFIFIKETIKIWELLRYTQEFECIGIFVSQNL